MTVTESKMFISANGEGMVSHRRRVRHGAADLWILSTARHDRHTEALEADILKRAQARGGDFVRFSDITQAMEQVNAQFHGTSLQASLELPCGPQGVLAKVTPYRNPDHAPFPRPLPQQQLDAKLGSVPLRLKVIATKPELCRYAARAGAYLWNDLRALSPDEQRALESELSAADSQRPLANRLGLAAVDRVQSEQGWVRNPGIVAYCLPSREVAKQARVHCLPQR